MRKLSLLQRLRAKKRNQSVLAVVTWYVEETWTEVKASATDPECFENSFSEWEALAVSTRRELQRSGVRTVECLIDPKEFLPGRP